jgi:hypothetical protein
MKLKIISTAHHRNGVDGAPFDLVLFKDHGPEGSRKIGVLFDQPHHCAVLDVAKLAQGDIAFRSNSWRGDQYERHLRKAIDSESLEATGEQQEANGRLIVAAPALFAACRMVIDRCEHGDLAEAARACHAAVAIATNVRTRTTQQTKLCTPWSLHFDRDGTEDFAVVYDSNEDELARSRFFWLPESNDPIPTTLAAMLLMVAAPQLLEVLETLAEQADQDCPSEYRSRHFSDALEQANTVIAVATEWAAGANVPTTKNGLPTT